MKTATAKIRYACPTSPGMDKGGLAFQYLQILMETGLGVRIMPIGVALFDRAPWDEVPEVFTNALDTEYINVVCAPPGLTLGANISAAQFGNDKASEDPAYKPTTAIAGLYTIGVPNIAILDGKGDFEPEELEALKKYSKVMCSTLEGIQNLFEQGGVFASVIDEPKEILSLFSDMFPA